MNSTFRYILIGLGIIIAVLSIWYFIHIVAYILISAVLALIGRPIVEMLGRIRIWKIKLPSAVRALISLLLMWTIAGLFLWIFIPLIASEVQNLSGIDPQVLYDSFADPIKNIEVFIDKFKISGAEHFTVQNFFTQKVIGIFNVSFLSNILGTFAGILGNIFIAFFSISFISFFFLRDEKLFAEGILTLVPDKYVEPFKHAMNSSQHLLRRYFIGMLCQIFSIFIMVTIGLSILGIEFHHTLLIALIAATTTIIPYIGPLIGSTVGILLGITTHLDLDFYNQILPLAGWMVVVFLIVHLIDNIISQPFIFSSSVKAHPLEIFILLLIAGSIAGVAGMMLAIPTYTVCRVFAKEFFNKFKVVKKLTKNIT
jgi:predicted PurR-regulated permease PerM